MLPISVKLLRRLYTWKRFSVLFSLLYVVYLSPKFLFRGLRIPLPPPPLPAFCSAAFVLFYWKFARCSCLQNSPDFRIGSERALARGQRKGLDWEYKRRMSLAPCNTDFEKKNSTIFQSTGAAMMNTYVSDLSLVTDALHHSWRWTWSTSFFAFGSSLNTFHGVVFLLVVHKSC